MPRQIPKLAPCLPVARHGAPRQPPTPWRYRLALVGLLLLPAGCAWVGLPAPAMPGSGNQGMEELLRDRVWLDQSPRAGCRCARSNAPMLKDRFQPPVK